jgi:pyrroline-5-carboxylate reductase
MLGVKPQKLDEVAPALAERVTGETIIVSILAGTGVDSLARRFPAARATVRAMPNLPVADRNGVTATYSANADPQAAEIVDELMGALGLVVRCGDEAMLGAVGAVAASGPAYVARFAAAMAAGGAKLGLPADVAQAIAAATLVGTGSLAAGGLSLAEIARRVASPAGTTEQGLAVLDAPGGLQPLVDRMLEAAVERGRQLAETAGRGD